MQKPPRDYASLDVFRSTVRYFPTVSVNIIVQRPDGAVLFLKRLNNPAKGKWWVPGGRILNGERIADAMLSLLKDETGLTGELVAVSPEYLEELWETDEFTEEDRKLYPKDTPYVHYLATAGLVHVRTDAVPVLDAQSGTFEWFKKIPEQHPYLRAYFEALKRMGFETLPL